MVNPKISSYDELITHYETEYSKLMINNTKPNFKNFKWYNLTGKLNNFRDLVNEVGLQDSEYEVSYSLPSISLHGTDIVNKIKIPKSRNENLFEGELEKFDNIKAMLALHLKNITEDIVKFTTHIICYSWLFHL